jgi:glucoamylase
MNQAAKYWLRLVATAILALSAVSGTGIATDAPASPGSPSVWASATKDFLGTAISSSSRVYFSGAEGVLTEIFYPTLDRVQNVDLQFLITDTLKTWGDEERRQKQHQISLPNKRAMLWQAVTTADSGRWKLTKKFFADPNRDTVVERVTFQTLEPGKTVSDYNVYLLNNPAINNTGAGDNSRTLVSGARTMLVASEPNSTSSALAASLPWTVVGGNQMISNGFVGTNDGFTDLFRGMLDRTMDWRFDGAFDGNVAQTGWVDFGGAAGNEISFDVAIAFGGNEAAAISAATATLRSDLNALEAAYVQQWVTYTNSLNTQNGRADDQYYLAVMSLKAIQDKSNGAMIAGAGTPWGEDNGDSNQGGYHSSGHATCSSSPARCWRPAIPRRRTRRWNTSSTLRCKQRVPTIPTHVPGGSRRTALSMANHTGTQRRWTRLQCRSSWRGSWGGGTCGRR